MFDKIKGFSLVFMIVLLSLVFVLQFGGSQAEGCTSGGGGAYVAKVHDTTINQGDLYAVYALAGFDRMNAEELEQRGVRQMVLDGIVERSLLAHEARQLGFDVSQEDVMAKLTKDGTARLTIRSQSNEVALPVKDKDGNFDREYAKRFINNGLRRSIGDFSDWQIDEILAERMRQLVASTVSVSDAEAWQEYADDNDKAQIEYIRFSPRFYARSKPLDDNAIKSWMAENKTKVNADYEANKHKYTGLEEEVRARHILIKWAPGATADDKASSRAKAESLLKKAKSGASFAELAKANSQDEGSAKKGGDLGFNSRGKMVKSFDDAQFELGVGEISDLVESRFGFHIIKAEEKREGDIPREIADFEIAKRLAQQEYSASEAKKAADRVLTQWRQGKTSDAIKAQMVALKKNASDAKKGAAPELVESRLFGWGENPISGLQAGPVVASAMELGDGVAFPDAPVKAGNELVVYRLVNRERPSKEAFTDEIRQQTRDSIRSEKSREAIALHVAKLRKDASKDQALKLPAPAAPPQS